VKLGLWNGRIIASKRYAFQLAFDEAGCDMFFGTETGFKEASLSEFDQSDYKLYPSIKKVDGVETGRRGLAGWLKEDFKVKQRNGAGENVEWMSLEVDCERQETVTFLVVYVPDGNKPFDATFIREIVAKGPVVVCGDFNCHHRKLWSRDTRENASGKAILSIIEDGLLELISKGVPTHDKGGQLDLWLSSPDLAGQFEVPAVGGCYGSDHSVVTVEFELQASRSPFPKRRYNYNAMNEGLYQAVLREKLLALTLPREASSSETRRFDDEICKAIQAARDRSVPTVEAKSLKKYRATPQMARLIERRHRAMRQYRATGDPSYKVMADAFYARFKELAVLAEERKHERNLTRMEKRRRVDSGAFFRIYGQIAAETGSAPGPAIRALTRATGEIVTGDAAKAEEMKEYYVGQLNPVPKPESDPEIRAHHAKIGRIVAEEKDLFEPVVTDVIDIDVRVSRVEMRKAVNRLKLKAPGRDEISNVLIKKGGPLLFQYLRRLYNCSLACGFVPERWKLAVIVPLPRAGKDLSKPSGYRPVSLLPTIAKLLELILATRIALLFRNNKLIPDHQSGFQVRRSTSDQTFRFSQARAMARRRKTASVMVAALLDFEGAFNAVCHNSLRVKLRDCAAVPRPLVRWVSSFLSGRTFTVKVSNCFSEIADIGSGVPQGSSLSPILFAFFTADLMPDNNSDERKAFTASFADDVLLFAVACYTGLAKVRVQRALTRVDRWSRMWRLPLSPPKCQRMRWGGGKFEDDRLFIGDAELPKVKTAKYLGVTFDSAGSWRPHFDNVEKDARSRLGVLRRVCYPGSPLSFRSRLLLYLTVIRPVLEYSCVAWLDASNAQKRRLVVLQNNCLRAVAGVSILERHSEDDLCRLTGVEPLEKRWLTLATGFAERAKLFVPPVAAMIADHRKEEGVSTTPLGRFLYRLS